MTRKKKNYYSGDRSDTGSCDGCTKCSFYFIIKGELEIRTLEEEYETRTAGVRSTAGGNYRKNISGR
ncbi:hypothetical protein RUMOBE_01357 [Blautia obeum ATCC 29174]|uniref:Uncharacterized protein n=1 Tax=Blautia obeum ATCC 29174 TaxID=411459 RepID=A5ZQT0_9FIRM|nr:hypothetical protein RUMOBE_01357 [Blautia obeum ATCC 29174]